MSSNKRKRARQRQTILAWTLLVLSAVLLFILCICIVSAIKNKKNIKDESVVEDELVYADETDEDDHSKESDETDFDNNIKTDEPAIDESDEEISDSDNPGSDPVMDLINGMTLEEKVCQMFFVTPEQLTGVETVTAAGETTKNAIDKYPVGGIILFGQNIVSPDQISSMTTNIQLYSDSRIGLPMFIGIDEEGGRVARIAKNDAFAVNNVGPMADIAANYDSSKAYEVGEYIGSYLKEYGINIDFAPDADVITESENHVIGDRSFGTDARVVATYSLQYLNGLHSAGILGCPKHYPGHGGTKEDSHEGAAVSERTWDELSEAELVPFKTLIASGVSVIMASHIEVPKVTGDSTPTTLSPVLITDKLRNELGYNGVIITDAMNMGAISNTYSSSEACVKAIEAGVDIILMPADFVSAYNALIDAVNSGRISEDRINESLYRIIIAKQKI